MIRLDWEDYMALPLAGRRLVNRWIDENHLGWVRAVTLLDESGRRAELDVIDEHASRQAKDVICRSIDVVTGTPFPVEVMGMARREVLAQEHYAAPFLIGQPIP